MTKENQIFVFLPLRRQGDLAVVGTLGVLTIMVTVVVVTVVVVPVVVVTVVIVQTVLKMMQRTLAQLNQLKAILI